MKKKKTPFGLDEATVKVMQRVLASPPKPHDDMKLGQSRAKKKRGPKGRASSAKPRSV